MSTFKKTLASLIAAAPDDLDESALAELATAAATLAKYGTAPPVTAPTAKPDPKVAARAKLAELQASPLSPHASDRLKCERAGQVAELYAIVHGMEGRTDHNGFFVPTPPEAA